MPGKLWCALLTLYLSLKLLYCEKWALEKRPWFWVERSELWLPFHPFLRSLRTYPEATITNRTGTSLAILLSEGIRSSRNIETTNLLNESIGLTQIKQSIKLAGGELTRGTSTDISAVSERSPRTNDQSPHHFEGCELLITGFECRWLCVGWYGISHRTT